MGDMQRADPFAGDLDLSGFGPSAAKKPPTVQKDVIRKVSEANNFPSRAAERPAVQAKPPKKEQRRRRTGRNVQFNIKATSMTIDRFTALADKLDVPFGELLERACDALEQGEKEHR